MDPLSLWKKSCWPGTTTVRSLPLLCDPLRAHLHGLLPVALHGHGGVPQDEHCSSDNTASCPRCTATTGPSSVTRLTVDNTRRPDGPAGQHALVPPRCPSGHRRIESSIEHYANPAGPRLRHRGTLGELLGPPLRGLGGRPGQRQPGEEEGRHEHREGAPLEEEAGPPHPPRRPRRRRRHGAAGTGRRARPAQGGGGAGRAARAAGAERPSHAGPRRAPCGAGPCHCLFDTDFCLHTTHPTTRNRRNASRDMIGRSRRQASSPAPPRRGPRASGLSTAGALLWKNCLQFTVTVRRPRPCPTQLAGRGTQRRETLRPEAEAW